MKITRSRIYRTFVIEWDTDRPRIILGLTGMDRPSLEWHLRGWFGRRRVAKENRDA